MCKFASFVLTKDKVFWLPDSESHEDIVGRHGLHADGARGPNILRVEIVPADSLTDLDSWVYHIDQDDRPEWFDADFDESRVRVALPVKLTALKTLNLSGTQVKDIPATLTALKRLVADPAVIAAWKRGKR